MRGFAGVTDTPVAPGASRSSTPHVCTKSASAVTNVRAAHAAIANSRGDHPSRRRVETARKTAAHQHFTVRARARGTAVALHGSVAAVIAMSRDRISHTLAARRSAMRQSGTLRASRTRAGGTQMKLITRAHTFIRSNEGQDLLEYALLVALIALVAVVAITATGTNVKTIFNTIASKLVVPA
jgi:pilus assembly protein Flp/PilA